MKSGREKLKRDKLDFTERVRSDSYKSGSLLSHLRPHTDITEVRCPDRTLDRALTEPLPGREDELCPSSSSPSDSSSSLN